MPLSSHDPSTDHPTRWFQASSSSDHLAENIRAFRYPENRLETVSDKRSGHPLQHNPQRRHPRRKNLRCEPV